MANLYRFRLRDSAGNVQLDADVFIREPSTLVQIPVYSDASGSTLLTQPLHPDATSGVLEFYTSDTSFEVDARTSAGEALVVFPTNDEFWVGTSGGSANAQTGSIIGVTVALTVGVAVRFIAGFSNTGSATFNFNSTGAKTIKHGASTLVSGHIQVGVAYLLTYDGTDWQIGADSRLRADLASPASGLGSDLSVFSRDYESSVRSVIAGGGPRFPEIITTQKFKDSASFMEFLDDDTQRQEVRNNANTDNLAPYFEEASTYANSKGGLSILVPQGTFNFATQAQYFSNTHFVGEGPGSILKVSAASGYDFFRQASVNVDNVLFRGLLFDGSLNYPADSTVYKQTFTKANTAISSSGVAVTNITVDQCIPKNLSGGFVDFNGFNSKNIVVSNNKGTKWGYKNSAILVRAPAGAITKAQRPTNVRVFGNYVDTSGPQYHYDPSKEDWVGSADGIQIDRGNGVSIYDNHLKNIGSIGIRVEDSLRARVLSNHLQDIGGDGITFYKNTDNSICALNTGDGWGKIPFAYAIRNYSGTYVVAREFPDAALAPLPADPTASTWFEVWPYSLDNINTANIIAYSASDYYTGPSQGSLPFRGNSFISQTQETVKTQIIGNTGLGNLSLDGSGKYQYSADFGISCVHPANAPVTGTAEDSIVSANEITDPRVYRIYHPNYTDPINARGQTGTASYFGNRDSSSAIDAKNSRVTQTGTIFFPAAQVPANSPNALDDYEEGEFTTAMTATVSGTVTLGNATLGYTKVGRKVTIHGEITVASVSSPTGDIELSLPFPNATSTTHRSSYVARTIMAYSLTGAPTGIAVGHMESSATKLTISILNNFVVSSIAANLQAGSAFRFSLTYSAAN